MSEFSAVSFGEILILILGGLRYVGILMLTFGGLRVKHAMQSGN
jgi:hypothetical protein